MKIIEPVPYTIIKDRPFSGDTKLAITKDQFRTVPYNSKKTTTFSFQSCFFRTLIIENTEEIDVGAIQISFYGCYIENIQIGNISTRNLSIHFGSSVLSGIISSKHLEYISCNNCIIRGLFISNQKKVYISLTEENIFVPVWLKMFERLKIKHFSELIVDKQILAFNDCKDVRFTVNEADKKFSPGFYRISRSKEKTVGYRLTPLEKRELKLQLIWDYSDIEDENVTLVIENAMLNSLSISGHPRGRVLVESCTINHLFLHDFSPKEETVFFNIKPDVQYFKAKTSMEVHRCNMDNAWFDNVHFETYNLVSFYRSKLGKATFTSCSFPRDLVNFNVFQSLKNVHYPDEKHEAYYKDQYETFLQLKNALESTGNIYESQKLFAVSNEALKKLSGISRYDKGILWINGKSNDHGLSVKRPIIGFFVFSIPLYVFYLWTLGRMFNSNKVDKNLIGYYFSFIDITHRSDFLVDKSNLNGGALSIDYINKLLISFFIYQFIAAFRKYGRK